jgi:hypothetical protein
MPSTYASGRISVGIKCRSDETTLGLVGTRVQAIQLSPYFTSFAVQWFGHFISAHRFTNMLLSPLPFGAR